MKFVAFCPPRHLRLDGAKLLHFWDNVLLELPFLCKASVICQKNKHESTLRSRSTVWYTRPVNWLSSYFCLSFPCCTSSDKECQVVAETITQDLRILMTFQKNLFCCPDVRPIYRYHKDGSSFDAHRRWQKMVKLVVPWSSPMSPKLKENFCPTLFRKSLFCPKDIWIKKLRFWCIHE